MVSAKLSNMQKTLVSIKCLCNCHSTSTVVGSVVFEKQVRKGYKLQNCSGHCRMSSFLKDPQRVAVRTVKHGSKATAVLPLTQRVDRQQNDHTFLSSDEPCWQSYAARGRPRLSYREEHRKAPVKLAAAQAGPWHRPANYHPLNWIQLPIESTQPEDIPGEPKRTNELRQIRKQPLRKKKFSQHERQNQKRGDGLYECRL